MESRILHVATGKSYDIHVGRGLLAESGKLISAVAKTKKIALITDSTVDKLYSEKVIKSLQNEGFCVLKHVFPAGETSKNHETLLEIYHFLASNNFNRTDLVVALGGGVVGDVAGFAAATFMRGMDFVQIPTTLLAEVDSSIGGKTAVDLPEGKNLVGAFHQPSLVICDPETLKTLPRRVFCDGMAEAIKHTCIKNGELFEELLGGMECNVDFICENIDIKRRVVERDECEHGERMFLNFGHTLGHAIEKVYNYKTYTHGEAVAIGMVKICEIAEKRGLTESGTAEKIKSLLNIYNLPTDCEAALSDIVAAAASDKKHARGGITIVLLKKIGESFLYRLSDEEFTDFFLGETK